MKMNYISNNNSDSNVYIASNIANYVTVLDSVSGIVCVYSIDHWNIDEEPIEEFLINQGHDTSNCQWMVHSEAPELWAKGLYYDGKSDNEYYEFER